MHKYVCASLICFSYANALQQGDEGLSGPAFAPAYNAPGRIETKNAWNVDVDASFIYWCASETVMDMGAADNPGSVTKLIANQSFKYKPGFKVGVGFNTHHDNWSIGAEYTWLYQTVSNTFRTSSSAYTWQIYDWFIGTDTVTNDLLNTSWKLHFNLLDLYLTRPFYQGRYFTLSPYAGLRGGWIRQNVTHDSGEAHSNVKSKNWMIGPNVGMQGHWLLGMGFRIETDAEASLLYTKFTNVSIQDSLFTGNFESANTSYPNYFTPVLGMGIGLGWGRYFSKDAAHFDCAVRYDLMSLWNQNVMRYFIGSTFDAGRPVGDLMLQGLTVTARFDF